MSTKYRFVLKSIDISSVHKKFGIDVETEKNVTKISDLGTAKDITVSFLDEAKKSHMCVIPMIDMGTGNGIECTKSDCFWCTESFNWNGIGCPIAYNDTQITKTYYSSINKNTYTIKENINQERAKKINAKPGTYITDGVFCSFECIIAWINHHKHIRIYDNSITLVHKLYKDITGKFIKKITPASDRRVLKKFGGTESIEDFRKNFSKIDHEKLGSIIGDCIIIKPLITLYEKNFNF